MSQKPYDLIIQGGICLLPHPSESGLIEHQADIAITDGRIEKIRDSINEPALKIIKAHGLHVLPGVIDSQVHFREPGLTHKEDLETGTRAAVLGGVTSIFEMPNTNPSTTTKEAFEDKLQRAKNRAHCNYAFFIGGAHDNVAHIAELELMPHCSGVKIFMGSSTGNLLVEDDETLEQILKETAELLKQVGKFQKETDRCLAQIEAKPAPQPAAKPAEEPVGIELADVTKASFRLN